LTNTFEEHAHGTRPGRQEITMFRYDPPAKLDDLAGRPTRQGFLDDWHDFITKEFVTNIDALTPNGGAAPFFTETTTAATSADLAVTWDAFPLAIGRLHPNDREAAWIAADQPGSTTRADLYRTGAAAGRILRVARL
jgi:hypothetical protein